MRRHGFAGLRDGLNVLAGIATNFWGRAFPELDEDGVEGKVVFGRRPERFGRGRHADPAGSPDAVDARYDGQFFALELRTGDGAREDNGSEPQDGADRRRIGDDGAVRPERRGDLRPRNFTRKWKWSANACAALKTMSDAFDAVAGTDSPPISGLRELLEQINSSIRHFAAEKLAGRRLRHFARRRRPPARRKRLRDRRRRFDGPGSARRRLFEPRGGAVGPGQDRHLFRKTEPHSPISYTLEEAVRRARMTLPELLSELSADPAHIQHILMAAGIRNVEAVA